MSCRIQNVIQQGARAQKLELREVEIPQSLQQCNAISLESSEELARDWQLELLYVGVCEGHKLGRDGHLVVAENSFMQNFDSLNGQHRLCIFHLHVCWFFINNGINEKIQYQIAVELNLMGRSYISVHCISAESSPALKN